MSYTRTQNIPFSFFWSWLRIGVQFSGSSRSHNSASNTTAQRNMLYLKSRALCLSGPTLHTRPFLSDSRLVADAEQPTFGPIQSNSLMKSSISLKMEQLFEFGPAFYLTYGRGAISHEFSSRLRSKCLPTTTARTTIAILPSTTRTLSFSLASIPSLIYSVAPPSFSEAASTYID